MIVNDFEANLYLNSALIKKPYLLGHVYFGSSRLVGASHVLSMPSPEQ